MQLEHAKLFGQILAESPAHMHTYIQSLSIHKHSMSNPTPVQQDGTCWSDSAHHNPLLQLLFHCSRLSQHLLWKTALSFATYSASTAQTTNVLWAVVKHPRWRVKVCLCTTCVWYSHSYSSIHSQENKARVVKVTIHIIISQLSHFSINSLPCLDFDSGKDEDDFYKRKEFKK